jgi:heme oxygenase (mycobilin-producing)
LLLICVLIWHNPCLLIFIGQKNMFVTINYIPGNEKSRYKLEEFFTKRAKTIERIPGFNKMQVLKPVDEKGDYLIISQWDSQEDFQKWAVTDDFLDGHEKELRELYLFHKDREGKDQRINRTIKTYQEIKAWRKVKSWVKRIGVIGLIFILVKGLIWLAILLGAKNILN